MTDGMIGNAHVSIPDLIERVVAFRTLNYTGPVEFKEPNEFKVDIATGKIVRNEQLIKDKLQDAVAKHGKKEYAEDDALLGTLHSPQYNKSTDTWGREMVAKCGSGHKHTAPDHDCSCGLYCYYALKESSSTHSYNGREVAVCVSVAGHIEAHGTGMRVEKMRIEAMYALSYAGLGRLCEHMGVNFFPVESYSKDQFLEHCTEYGDKLPKTMRAGAQSEEQF